MTELKQIGEMVQARTLNLQRASADLVARGLEELARLELDPRLAGLIGQLRQSEDWDQRITAWQKLRELGPAVPGWREALRELIYHGDGWARILASEALAWHGCCPADTVPVLIAAVDASLDLRRHDWARAACGALGKYSGLPKPLTVQALPVLLRGLSAENHDVRGYAAMALGNLGKASRSALVKIANLLDRAEGALSECYLEALRKIDPAIDSAMDAWVSALDHDDPAIRADAVSAIGRKGNGASRAVPDLLRMAQDYNAEVRKMVALALARIEVANQSVLTRLQHLSSDSDPAVRLASVYALFKLGDRADERIKQLRAGLGESEPAARLLCAWALGNCGSAAGWLTRRALARALRREQVDEVRSELERALMELKHPSRP
ncbi:hypothetical protein DESUT3_06950 [Desulfuromonas versatilis]|uniref:HEAT repeat domain-containing protein n=1 Tax=Desulfuromonas versatilis TaxID=2802975 RepID=A0ABN6DWT5_9BACT|nr:HEAT repeat domain-containing protein [Desulfuromonas versatilis]BCR03626.1 hypothetical protein DESUT3_06950 [Desulfuromonas versatilis]